MLFASGFVQALAEFAALSFHRGQAADQAAVLALEDLMLLGHHGQAAAQVQKFPIAFLAADTRGTTRGHGDLQELYSARGRLIFEVLEPRCILIVRAESRSRNRLRKGCFPGREKT
jgi:hypothetical protein